MKIPFKVSARTARLIGRENVANADAAIIELVKNSYDADASFCCIAMDSELGTLYIIDNGVGMTSKTIQEHWMVIGTQNKLNNFTSEQGRVQSGAKGIGRFALDRLGNKCTLLSNSQGNTGIKWNVDWGVFDKESNETIDRITADLDDFQYSHEDEIRKILGDKTPDAVLDTGVIIKIESLRDLWDDDDIKKLYSNLEALIPPREESFTLYLYDLNNMAEYGDVLPALCDDYDFKLEAKVEEGIATITIHRHEYVYEQIPDEFYKGKNAPFDKKTFKNGSFVQTYSLHQLMPGYDDENKLLDDIGDFSLSLYFMKLASSKSDAEKYFYKKFDRNKRSEWLEVFGGIKIFRDNFRVRPYGEPHGGSWDWLQLGNRHSNSPAAVSRYKQYRVRPQNIAGSIHISRLTNLKFEDKSSREGMQDNAEFNLFKNIVLSILRVLEDDRSFIASELLKIYNKNHAIQRLREEAEKESKKIAKSIKNKGDEEFTREEKFAVSIEAQKEEIRTLREEQRLLRAFASIGLTTSSFAHELSSIDRKLVSRFDDIENLFLKFVSYDDVAHVEEFLNPYVLIDENKKEDKKIKQWLKYTLESIRKDKRRRKNLNFCEYLDQYKKSWNFTLTERCVDLVISTPQCERATIRAFEIDIDTILNNLLMNSLDAFYRKREPHLGSERKIYISVIPRDKHVTIKYSDNGPGLSKDIVRPDDIFEPLFTTKKDRYGADKGTGLGMWLVKNVSDEYNAEAVLQNVGAGFCLNINFPLRKDYWNV